MNAPFLSASAGHDDTAEAIAGRWTALHTAASAVTSLAGRTAQAPNPEGRNFPALIRDAGEWRQSEAGKGVLDMAAMMEAGLSALLAVNARGADPQPAAEALWCEFEDARSAILALLPPPPVPGL